MVYQRTLKLFLNSFELFTESQIDNMAMYLDKNNNGMIDLKDIEVALFNPSSFNPHKNRADPAVGAEK